MEQPPLQLYPLVDFPKKRWDCPVLEPAVPLKNELTRNWYKTSLLDALPQISGRLTTEE
jgi:hypothetical protein